MITMDEFRSVERAHPENANRVVKYEIAATDILAAYRSGVCYAFCKASEW